MTSLKKQAMATIVNLPDDADIDELMYRLYVPDKIRKGKKHVAHGNVTSAENLRREIDRW